MALAGFRIWRLCLDINKAKQAFANQKKNAARRGIAWELTFEQWLDWWGGDVEKRGVRAWNLQMQRVADAGPYAIGNIRKGTPKDNGRTRSHVHQNHKAATLASERLDRECAPTDLEEPGEEDESISAYFSRDPEISGARGCKWDRIHRG